MDKRRIVFVLFVSFALLFSPSVRADDTALFTTVAPDALIILDLSGSMNWTPYGETMFTANAMNCNSSTALFWGEKGAGHMAECTISSTSVPKYGDPACLGPFARTSGIAGTTDCSRVAIAKRTLFDILDDNDSNNITSADDKSLNVRIGYMRFTTADDTAGNPRSGNIQIPTTPTDMGIGARYSRLYCNNATSCAPNANVAGTISGATASGGTPLVSALQEARTYLDSHKATDPAQECRQKFVILISDGGDTYACGGNGQEDQQSQYVRRRASVKRAKDLADQGYKVFVIGFGVQMPHYLRNTLNWMAYYGGTDNPGVANNGNTGAYDPGIFGATLCPVSSNLAHHNIDGDGDHWYALTNDPGEIDLSGYAFLAASSADLTAALKYAINIIREATYSFTQASVASSRLMDENYLYEGSFQPVNNDPFWLGHLKKYQINPDGTVGAQLWDAGAVLSNMTAASRNMFTLVNGSKTSFTTSNITASILGVADTTERDRVVNYFRGEAGYNPDGWRLGDVFHSPPINIGTPSPYYYDARDESHAFNTFRDNNIRSSGNGLRVVVTGANDGQVHGFRTGDGSEAWSFIPPNLLPKLKNVAHTTHPTALSHQYFVDGPITVADVWLGNGSGTQKTAAEWKTMLVFAEGQGAGPLLWSSSPHCASDDPITYSATYSAATPYYCGYWALNVTSSLNPSYMWRLNPSAAQGPYLGDPWSKVYVGRVKVAGQEKWVGFIGGGYNGDDCQGGGECDTRGKGFFVIDLQTGNILWSYNMGNDAAMTYSLPAAPAIADTDNDNFIDTAYIGDLGGNVWRFRFCSAADGDLCSYGNWQGTKLFNSSTGTIRPIYTTPSVALDSRGQIWVYFGTGDKTDPTAANAQEKFFAVKDLDFTGTRNLGDLDNITQGTYTDGTGKKGWYINLPGQGEKILADSAVFGNVAYFTTYTPAQSNDPCNQAGSARLYAVNYVSGGGILGGNRSMEIGTGIPTAPVLSLKPGGSGSPDLYVTVSGGSAGGGGADARTARIPFNPPSLANRTNVLYWRDTRLQ